MRGLLVGLLVVAAACAGGDPGGGTSPGGFDPTTTTTAVPSTVEFVGGERPARLVIPPEWEPDGDPMPLVVLLHGYSASGELQDVYLGVSATGRDLGYLTLTPNGTPDTVGNLFWNATRARLPVDDAAYLSTLIDEVIAGYNADAARVYIVGHSNGGFMANKLACDLPDRIAGIAAIAGGIFGADNACVEPMRVLVIQGTDDDTVPYDGGVFLGSQILGADETADRWLEAGGCPAASVQEGPFDFDLLVEGDETTITKWTECQPGAAVELWRMEGSGHVPGFRLEFRRALMGRLLGAEGE